MKQYYHILGLQDGATKEEIKRAYRKMAMQYHPDLNPGEESKKKFIEILEAYEYLTGIRKMNTAPGLSAEDLQKLYDLMQKAAEEKAKARYRQRVREFRKEQERLQTVEFQRGIFSFFGIIVLALAIWQGYKFYKNLTIDRDPMVTEATITGLATKRMIYQYNIGDSTAEEIVYASQYKLDILAENGMPLKIGDRFELEFSASQPAMHRINFEKVSPETMRRYLDLVARRLMVIYADEWQNLSERNQKIRATCLTLFIFNEYGFDGLSEVYYSDASFFDSFLHNSWRWAFFSQSEEYLHLRATCAADSMQAGY